MTTNLAGWPRPPQEQRARCLLSADDGVPS